MTDPVERPEVVAPHAVLAEVMEAETDRKLPSLRGPEEWTNYGSRVELALVSRGYRLVRKEDAAEGLPDPRDVLRRVLRYILVEARALYEEAAAAAYVEEVALASKPRAPDIATRLRELADLRAESRDAAEGAFRVPSAHYVRAITSLTPAQLRAVADVVEAARRMTDVGETFGVGFVRWVGQSRHELETQYDGLAAALAALDQAGGKE